MLAVIILTFNEEMHIARAIDSVKNFSQEIYVVDSFSTDNTVQIAKSLGATVVQRRFRNQADQFQWALDEIEIKSPWTMRLDADEYIGEDLGNNILIQIENSKDECYGLAFMRRHIFLGRWIKHGGRYPVILLRAWRTGHAYVEQRWMDEHIILKNGKTKILGGEFSDHNLNSISFFTSKHNNYASREALELVLSKKGLDGNRVGKQSLISSGGRTATKRFLKDNLYGKIPFGLAAFLYFSYRYFFLLGFLDGVEGAIYHFLQGYWYRFLVGAKVFEFERAVAGLDDEEALVVLSRISGLPLAI